MQIYGIKNCDTVKKALKFFDENSLEFDFHDFKKQPPCEAEVDEWFNHVDLEILINKRGTTWRKLAPEQQSFDDKDQLKRLIIENPTLLKRPLVNFNGQWIVGFNANTWRETFLK